MHPHVHATTIFQIFCVVVKGSRCSKIIKMCLADVPAQLEQLLAVTYMFVQEPPKDPYIPNMIVRWVEAAMICNAGQARCPQPVHHSTTLLLPATPHFLTFLCILTDVNVSCTHAPGWHPTSV